MAIVVGSKYEMMLNLVSLLYQRGKYVFDSSTADNKGGTFACYFCLQPIEEEHARFDIENDKLKSVFTVRLHKKCVESLVV